MLLLHLLDLAHIDILALYSSNLPTFHHLLRLLLLEAPCNCSSMSNYSYYILIYPQYSVSQYLSDANLGDPIAGTYFTQETGELSSTVSIEATTSVDSTTLPQFTQSSAEGEHSGTETGTGTRTDGAPPTDGTSDAVGRLGSGGTIWLVFGALVGGLIL